MTVAGAQSGSVAHFNCLCIDARPGCPVESCWLVAHTWTQLADGSLTPSQHQVDDCLAYWSTGSLAVTLATHCDPVK